MLRLANTKAFTAICSAIGIMALASCKDDNTNYILHPENYEAHVMLTLDIDDSECEYPEEIVFSAESKGRDGDTALVPASIPEDYTLHYVVSVANGAGILINTVVSDSPDLVFNLLPGDYIFYAWADFIPAGQRSSRDHWYFTDEPGEMLLKDKYGYQGGLHAKRAFAAAKYIRVADNPSSRNVSERITLTAPMGHYEFVATEEPSYTPGSVVVLYSGGLWGGHSIVDDRPVVRWSGVGYSLPFDVPESLACDYLIVPEEGETFSVTLQIYDTEGKLRARAKNVNVPVKRGHLTTISGDFFNILQLDEKPDPEQPHGGGIGIDTRFDNEYTITITK